MEKSKKNSGLQLIIKVKINLPFLNIEVYSNTRKSIHEDRNSL